MKKVGTLVTLAIVAMTQIALAGGKETGNGGGIESCPGATPPTERWQAYDVAEYSGDWGITQVDPSLKRHIPFYDGVTTKEQYLEKALTKIQADNAPLADAIRQTLQILNQKIQDSGQLSLISDTNIVFNRENCSYVQLVNWIDSREDMRKSGLPEREEYIFRDQKAYTRLDPLNQAANDLHEAVYKVKRIFVFELNTGSTYIRRFVAQAFSDTPIDANVYEKISPLSRAILESVAERDYSHTYVSKIYFPYECDADGLQHAQVEIINTSEDTVTLRGAVFTL